MKRHALSTRLWHWVNALSLVILFMSGLNISNAHPRLYWGDWGFAPEHAWLHLPRFPGWMTIPGHYSLSEARLWHLLLAWPFALGLLAFILAALANRHFRNDLALTLRDLRWSNLRDDIANHLARNFCRPGTKYNLLQKLAYVLVIFALLPLMIATGIAMSPAIDALWPWLVDLLGGRQTARSLHFLTAWALFAFLCLHLGLVLASGPGRQLRDMVTGGRA